MTTDEQPSALRLTAFHEAAHAVAALVVGTREVTQASIVPDHQFEGCVRLKPLLEGQLSTEGQPHPTDTRILRGQAVILLAGELAEEKAGRREPAPRETMVALDGDMHNAALVLSTMLGSDESPGEIIDEFLARTQSLVSDPTNWRVITAVAEALLDKGTLSGSKLAEIVASTGPLQSED